MSTRNVARAQAAAAAAVVFGWAALAAAPQAGTDAATALFANDLGAAAIDISKYPKNIQEGYQVFAAKCSQCHTLARPLNSQYIEEDDSAEMAQVKKEDPEDFGNKFVADVESKIWSRYVHRMMYKPGANISGRDGKKIWEFLVYDSKCRKLGLNGCGGPAQAAKWAAYRENLLKEFQKAQPAKFVEVYGKAGLAAR